MKKIYILVVILGLSINFSNLTASGYLDWEKAKQIVEVAKLPYNLARLYKYNQTELNMALMKAADFTSKMAVMLLLKAGADVNARDNKGKTALMRAALLGSQEVVALLLQAGADVNAVDRDGWTALMYAVFLSSQEVVAELLKARIDVNARDNNGSTAISLTRSPEIKQMLMRYKAFKFVKIDRLFDKMPEPEDYISEHDSIEGELSGQELMDSLTEEGLEQNEERVKAHMADLEIYWHYKVQTAYDSFVYSLDSQPLRTLFSQEETLSFISIIMSFFNSQEDFMYVLNELKVDATEQELERLSLIVEELNRIEQSTTDLLKVFF